MQHIDADSLPSWNDGPARSALLAFVDATTRPGSPGFVAPAERVATFDNDGTLWSEQPVYFQVQFAFDRIRALAGAHPEWAHTEPFRSVIAGDVRSALSGGMEAIEAMVAVTHAGMTTEEFRAQVLDWLTIARHPQTGQPYTAMVFQPMLEVLALLRAHGFRTYIVSGGGLEFMRAFAEEVYGVPPEQVIGSVGGHELDWRDGVPVIAKVPGVHWFDDKEAKPISIQRHIGRRPVAAFGNSDGDLAMLQWTAAGPGRRFCLYVRHTDGEREWAYDRSAMGNLSVGLEEAAKRDWTVVDMKRDWRVVFPPSAVASGGRPHG